MWKLSKWFNCENMDYESKERIKRLEDEVRAIQRKQRCKEMTDSGRSIDLGNTIFTLYKLDGASINHQKIFSQEIEDKDTGERIMLGYTYSKDIQNLISYLHKKLKETNPKK